MRHKCRIARQIRPTDIQMNRSRLQIAKADILAFFNENASPVLKEKEIAAHLSQQRHHWRLTQGTTVAHLVDFLQKSGNLQRIEIGFPQRPEVLYVWNKVPLFEILLHIKPRCYLSHYTAMRFHGLTEQVPKVIYLTHERSSRQNNPGLVQSAIDHAFHAPARLSNNEAKVGDRRIVLLNGAHTDNLGVVSQETRDASNESARVRTTNLERTLIDAVVRPAYCGGIFEVAKAFEAAKGDLSVNALCAMLQKLAFTYPYHQAIGFYLQRAGYRESTLDLVRRFPMEFDFYLSHGMTETRYVSDWRIHVPKGF